MPDESKLVVSFEKNNLEEVRFSLTEYKGKQLFDIRVYYLDDDEGWKPTKKGICLSRGLFPEFKEAVLALGKAFNMNPYLARKSDEISERQSRKETWDDK